MNWKHKYGEMGSRNKKTGKLSNYIVTRTHNNGVDSFECSCPATLYRPWLQACKHIKRLKEKMMLPQKHLEKPNSLRIFTHNKNVNNK